MPTRGFSLVPRRRRGGTLQLGYVETAEVDPLRASLIGLAPLVAGASLLALLTLDPLGLDLLSAAVVEGDVVGVIRSLQALFSRPGLALWIYLVFTVSNTMLPSRSDRAAWLAALAIVALLALVGLALGLADPVAAWAGPVAVMLGGDLAGVFLLAAGLDFLLLVPLLLLEIVLTRLVGWEIVY